MKRFFISSRTAPHRFIQVCLLCAPLIVGAIIGTAHAVDASSTIAANNLNSPFNVEQLMRMLAHNQSGRATFTEIKHIAVLDKPVESSGELLYSAPNRLEKRTLKPKVEAVLLDGNSVVVERGRQKFTLQLQDYPELAALIDSIRGTLAGDRAALERSYRLTLEGNAAQWTLALTPTNSKMLATIARIKIIGNQEEIRSMEMLQADGDRSVMQIEKIKAP